MSKTQNISDALCQLLQIFQNCVRLRRNWPEMRSAPGDGRQRRKILSERIGAAQRQRKIASQALCILQWRTFFDIPRSPLTSLKNKPAVYFRLLPATSDIYIRKRAGAAPTQLIN